MIFSSIVPPQRGGTRPLSDYLAERFTYYDREGWTAQIMAGKLTVDGCNAAPDDLVGAGQTVTYDPGEFEEPPADLSYSIIYEDEWLLAVNKPGNLLIHRAGRSFKNNLMYHLRSVHTPAYPDANSIHRLDRNTSGVVLIARNPRALAEISRQFRSRQIDKIYIALVHGIPAYTTGQIINSPIDKDPDSATGSKFRVDAAGKEAITRIESCEAVGTAFAQLTIKPLTGRTHQLRVHCAHIGHPLVGDQLYGSDRKFPTVEGFGTQENRGNECITWSRHALHCARITFYHPFKKGECSIEAPLPADMVELRKLLEIQ